LTEVRSLAVELREFIKEIRRDSVVTETLASARSATDGLEEIVQDNRADIRTLVDNFRQTSAALREALAGPDSSLADATAGARRAVTRADSVLTNLETASASLRALVDRLEAGEGSAGRFLTDESLYTRAESTMTAVEELVDDVRRNPRKYFKLSVIDF
jgi:phospholipid/cholesterol/gamma-HCH transport system substrate-binding protein